MLTRPILNKFVACRRALLLDSHRTAPAESKNSVGAHQDGLFLSANAQRGTAYAADVQAAEANTPAGDYCGGQRRHQSRLGQHLRLAAATLSGSRIANQIASTLFANKQKGELELVVQIHVLQIGHHFARIGQHILGRVEIRLGAHYVAAVRRQHG